MIGTIRLYVELAAGFLRAYADAGGPKHFRELLTAMNHSLERPVDVARVLPLLDAWLAGGVPKYRGIADAGGLGRATGRPTSMVWSACVRRCSVTADSLAQGGPTFPSSVGGRRMQGGGSWTVRWFGGVLGRTWTN